MNMFVKRADIWAAKTLWIIGKWNIMHRYVKQDLIIVIVKCTFFFLYCRFITWVQDPQAPARLHGRPLQLQLSALWRPQLWQIENLNWKKTCQNWISFNTISEEAWIFLGGVGYVVGGLTAIVVGYDNMQDNYLLQPILDYIKLAWLCVREVLPGEANDDDIDIGREQINGILDPFYLVTRSWWSPGNQTTSRFPHFTR